jgi:cell division protein FtsW
MSHQPRQSLDTLMLWLALALIAIGLVAISSASVSHAEHFYGNPWRQTLRHLMYLLIGFIAATTTFLTPIPLWRKASPWLLLLAIGLLVAVLIPGVGRMVNGSQRWLSLGPINFQPSEFAKLAMVVWLSGFLVRHGDQVRESWQGLAQPIAVLLFLALLLLAEPDFGATVILLGTAFGLLFMAGARLVYVIGLVAVALGSMVAMVYAAPYRMQRLMAYQDPWADPFGSGFQLIQSLIAYGRGEWFGVGLGNSIQKLFYLPEAHTDFVFSIWAEETGLVGAVAVIAIFAALVARIMWVGYQALGQNRMFEGYLCFGFALIFAGQAFVNMGVSSGLLPTKGLTLPFISYGGSSLIVSCMMLGMLLRVEKDREPANQRRARRKRVKA